MDIYSSIQKLLDYSMFHALIEPMDELFMRNRILELLNLDSYPDGGIVSYTSEDEIPESPSVILGEILDWAAQEGILEEDTMTFRDLLDAKIMGLLIPAPSQIFKNFSEIKEKEGIKSATAYYYDLSIKSDYIRSERIKKNMNWRTPTPYGELEITINLSKPEKDPRDIARERTVKSSGYPKCLLCSENEGYAGRINHPARQNHRIIPMPLKGEKWFLQYSPYVYYNEHSIVFSEIHRPMKISKESFDRLLDFVTLFPHYFIGSNADLPIVGGSILSHDHFQAGRHTFPMEIAPVEIPLKINGFEDIEAGIIRWPMSVIRLTGNDRERIAQAGELILEKWRNYSDESADVLAFTHGTPHNTVTPIARRKGKLYELDLVLRNNRTSAEHPLGIFHPHAEVHNIKKENIGLIEVMGLAVLPGRLKKELEDLKNILLEENPLEKIRDDEHLNKHYRWIESLPQNISLEDAVGECFSKVLSHAGVFKDTPSGRQAFLKFIGTL